MATESTNDVCPYCKEDIKPDAIKCRHCGSQLAQPKPSHEGICPHCKEEIHLEAVKCKHCQSSLNNELQPDCGCKQSSGDIGFTSQISDNTLDDQIFSELTSQPEIARAPIGPAVGVGGGKLILGGTGSNCFTKLRCKHSPFGGLICHTERCCFSPTIGWRCIRSSP